MVLDAIAVCSKLSRPESATELTKLEASTRSLLLAKKEFGGQDFFASFVESAHVYYPNSTHRCPVLQLLYSFLKVCDQQCLCSEEFAFSASDYQRMSTPHLHECMSDGHMASSFERMKHSLLGWP
jgi:hypothetical protein